MQIEVEITLEAEIVKHLQKAEYDIENEKTILVDKYFKELRVR